MAALAVLLFLPWAVSAQTTVITLISNTGLAGSSTSTWTGDRAQPFTTGSDAAGYTLSSVEIISNDLQSDDASVAVYTVRNNGFPQTLHASLTAPSDFAAGTLVFTAPAYTTLAASTTYTVVVSSPGGDSLTVDSHNNNSEDSGGAAGWSIGNEFDYINNQGNWVNAGTGSSLRIAVKGSVGAPPAPNRPHSLKGLVAHDQVELAWAAPNGGGTPDGYRILRRDQSSQTAGTFTTLVEDTGSAARTYTDTDSMSGKHRYIYRVAALNGTVVSTKKTGLFKALVPSEALTDPKTWKSHNLKAEVSGSAVDLKWQVRSTIGVTGYQILRREVGVDNIGDFTTLVDDTGSRSRTYTDSSVALGNTYVYRVKAHYSHGNKSGLGAATKFAKVTIP